MNEWIINDWTLIESAYVLIFIGGIAVISAILCGAWILGKWMLDRAYEASMKPKKVRKSRYTFVQQLMQDYNNHKACNDCVNRMRNERRGRS